MAKVTTLRINSTGMADATRIVRNLSIERSSSVWMGRVSPAALHARPVPGVLREEFFKFRIVRT
jgi:hypothetical protein